jgi:PhzF family phenazine biosynthesis protein
MKTYIVDSFTNEAFKGNPAGVCLLAQPITDVKMLSIAKELNLSETAFIQRLEANHTYSIRYFSPKMEIPLCGHATLASAKVVFESTALDEIHFITIQNLDLVIRKIGVEISMEFPVYELVPAEVPKPMLQALGLQEVVSCAYNKETNILLLEISSADTLAALSPDYNALIGSHHSINGVLVTAPSDNDQFDFHSRYFWPWSGTNEDPVTGATHTFLARYWSKKLSKNKMRSFQSSVRSGYMEVELVSDTRLLIKSNAVIVFEGKLII